MISTDTADERQQQIRALFDQYIQFYAARDERLMDLFSHDFSGFAGGGNVLIKNREEWVKITRQDFAEAPKQIKIKLLDLTQQDMTP